MQLTRMGLSVIQADNKSREGLCNLFCATLTERLKYARVTTFGYRTKALSGTPRFEVTAFEITKKTGSGFEGVVSIENREIKNEPIFVGWRSIKRRRVDAHQHEDADHGAV